MSTVLTSHDSRPASIGLARSGLAGLALLFFLGALALAASEPWHRHWHKDQTGLPHQCLVTLLLNGYLEQTGNEVRSGPVAGWLPMPAPVLPARFWANPPCFQHPQRAPPA